MKRNGGALLWLSAMLILIAACTEPRPESAPDDDEQSVSTVLNEIGEGIQSISGDAWEVAIESTQAVFESAPVVFLASADDPRSQDTATSEAIDLGVPTLLSPSDAESRVGEVAQELERLQTQYVVAVGGGAEALPEGTWQVIDYDEGDDSPLSELPDVEPGSPDSAAAAIVGADPEASIGVSNLEAGRIPLLTVEDSDLQGSPEAIEFLSESGASKVLTLGEDLAQDPALGWRVRAAQTGYELPGGGQSILTGRQYVALYGSPGEPVLGALGQQDLDSAITRVQELSGEYQELTEKSVVPSFEIIATVASAHAGSDGDYSNELPVETLRPWVERAGEEGVKVILDLQPGRTNFLTQAKIYQELLEMPHVGLALDPEWRLKSDQVHLVQIGSVTAKEVNEVTEWLATMVNEQGLPPKMLVLHQFRTSMIADRDDLDLSHPEVALLIHADGQGSQPAKQETWRTLHIEAPEGIGWGWKNFYEKDSPMLTPKQTMDQVDPAPDLVTYQ